MSLDKNKTIGVFFGSRSPEHDVSIITACLIISGLRDLGYKIVPIYIGKDGVWYVHDELGEIEFFQDKNYQMKLKSHEGWSISLGEHKNQMVLERGGLLKKSVVIDVAFPAFHGRNGEDGTIQGLFELQNIPYVGCDVLSSALSMHKVMTKEFYEHAGIPTTSFVSFNRKHWNVHRFDIRSEIEKLKLPLFVKPSRSGSSIGITKVSDMDELDTAIEVALHYDTDVLVEEGVHNMADLTCAVIGHNDVEVSLVQESLYGEDLFSYDDKYINGGGAQTGEDSSSFRIPPVDIDSKTLEKVQLMSKTVFSLMGCSGIARVDFLYDRESKKIYVNEVNTMPGTLYHHLWKESGINFATLLEKLLDSALERQKESSLITRSFSSTILEKSLGSKLAGKMKSD